MKKLFFFVAVATLTTGTMVSCGKSSKGKMDSDWTIDSHTDKSTSTSGSGVTSTETVEYANGKKTTTYVSGGNTTKETATLNDAKWSIKKDGTWERTVSYTEVDTTTIGGTNLIVTTNTTTIDKGNWDFLTGVGEFKKNERVSFSTLSSESTVKTTQNINSTTSTDKYTNTYLDGENTETYVISESKKKSLSLTYTGASSSTNASGNNSTTTKETLDKSFTLSSN